MTDGHAVSAYERRMRWFHQARFGMFIHYGLYSLLERGEWVMFTERIPTAEYARLADRFRASRFDAAALARLARRAGMKYMVLTTRHHDGFCLYDSRVSDFTTVRTACGRDLVGEFVRACRTEGLRVGLYYSLLDWRFPGYHERTKYPESAEALVRQAHAQMEELMTRYGRIDLLFYDGGWLPDSLDAEVYGRFWRAKELNALVRRHQPQILINDRAGVAEDFDTPEQVVTASARGRGWVSCMTIGDHCTWGYARHNPNRKSVCQLLQYLVNAAAGEGNFLLNVGPKGDGSIVRDERVRLEAMGDWLAVNGEAIYGCRRCDLVGHGEPGIIDFSLLGPWTRKGQVGYWHIYRWPGREAVAQVVGTRALSAELLGAKGKLRLRQEHNGRLVITGLPPRPPSPYVNVLKVRFADVPRRLAVKDLAAWLAGEAGRAS